MDQFQVNYTLFKNLLYRQIREQYLSSMGGMLWVFLLPALQLAVYGFVFVEILKVRQLPGFDATGFVPYLAVAFWPWIAFSDALAKGTISITSNRELIGKIALPHVILVLSDVTAAFMLHTAGYLLILVILQLTGTDISWINLPYVFWILVQLYLFTLGLALILSATQVYIRDLSHALAALLMLLFFATPILYTIGQIPERFRHWFELNPLYYFMHEIRQNLLLGTTEISWLDGIALLSTVLILVLGYVYFRRLSYRFEDFL